MVQRVGKEANGVKLGTAVGRLLVLCLYSFLLNQANAGQYSLSTLSLDELTDIKVSTASKMLEPLEQAPATIYVITDNDILNNGYINLQDALKNVPGMEMIDLGFFEVGGQRGFLGSFSQTLLLQNGREMQNLVASEAFITNQYSTHNIKRIEVLNGPGSALYGANAFAGVVNIITKNDDPNYNDFEFNIDMDSVGTRAASFTFGQDFGGLHLSGSGRHFVSDGWDFSKFVADQEHFSDGSSTLEKTTSTANSSTYSDNSEADPYSLKLAYNGFYVGRDAYYIANQTGLENVELRYDLRGDFRHFSLNYFGWENQIYRGLSVKVEHQQYNEIGWGRSNIVTLQGLIAQATNAPSSEPPINLQDVHDNFTVVYSQKGSGGSSKDRTLLETHWQFGLDNDLIAGVSHAKKDIMGAAIGYTDAYPEFDKTVSEDNYMRHPEYQSTMDSLYLQYKKPIVKSLDLTLGSRWDKQSIWGRVNTIRSGLVWSVDPQTIFKVLYGEAFREPSILELGTSIFENKVIQPEKMKTVELAASHVFTHQFRFQSTFFISRAENLIVPSSTIYYQNSDKIEINRGIENMFWFQSGDWGANVAYTYINPENQTVDNKQVDSLNVYQHRVSAEVDYDLNLQLRINVHANYYSALDAEHGNPKVTQVILLPDATTFDTNLVFHDKAIKKFPVEGVIGIKNLFDAQWYQPNVRNTGPKEYLQPGRILEARINLHF